MKNCIQAKFLRGTAVILLTTLLLILTLTLASYTDNAQAQSNNPDRQSAQTVIVSASRDNTLYESDAGSLSNGAGQYFFAGSTSDGAIRRGLITFDLSGAIPGGATILSATLILNMSKSINSIAQPIALHSVLTLWGEGVSDAAGEEGGGTAVSPGDATWLHTFYDSTLWTNVGGDFAATASAITAVGAIGSYQWSSPQMVNDIQNWRNNPSTNFGWLLQGNETTGQTAKRFDSRENPTTANRPRLVITYEPPIFDFHTYLPYVTKAANP